jgi:alkanesulfonate monooxygenase SsuD/methylene tetrahydromethanopterin reductase-like flavin-dependent oxidoreductase (luciferase family)
MLDREGADGPADVAIVGSEHEVSAQVRRLAAVGATDFIGAPFGTTGEINATIEALAGLVNA